MSLDVLATVRQMAIENTEKTFAAQYPLEDVARLLQQNHGLSEFKAKAASYSLRPFLKPSEGSRIFRNQIHPFTCMVYEDEVGIAIQTDEDGDPKLYTGLGRSLLLTLRVLEAVTRPTEGQIEAIVSTWYREFFPN